MTKKVKLADVPFGKTFEVWEHKYTALDGDDKGILSLEDDVVTKMPFRDNDTEYKIAPNDFRDSSVMAYLDDKYVNELVTAGAKLGDDIFLTKIDLKCVMGQREYEAIYVEAGLLTLEQYGKYYDIIPKIDTPYWLATPWKTPSYSQSAYQTNYVWAIYANGNCDHWICTESYGVRPVLTLSPSLLVSVDVGDQKEDKWHEYLEYLIHWAISHSDKGFAGCCPVCYDEWLDAEGSKDSQ